MALFSETDKQQLNEYLTDHVVGFSGLRSLEKFSGGQSNPTYKLMADSGVYVLRRQPPGKLLKSAHAVDREYKVLNALVDTTVAVAKVYHLCEDVNIIGSMFYIMDFVDGDIFWSATLATVTDNDLRAAMYDAMNKTLVALHSVDVDACGLTDYGRKEAYFERQLSRWTKQYRASELDTINVMDKLIDWLEKNIPVDDGQATLVHGDYRLDNIIFKQGSSEILAVLDWELSTLGHPYADLAYQCMQLRMPPNTGVIDGLLGIDRKALGIPTEKEYVTRYCQRMGLDKIDNWAFYLAFSFFRLASIAQGVAKRSSQGNASNEQATKAGSFVEPLATMALAVIRDEQ